MKYMLIHNLEEKTKEKALNGFIKEAYQVVYEDEKNIIIKKNKEIK